MIRTKKEKITIMKAIMLFVLALVLILIDKVINYHISALLFFSIIFFMSLPIIIYKIFKWEFYIAPIALNYFLFFYLSVYYIIIPACKLHDILRIIVFVLIIIALLIVSGIGLMIITLIADGLFSNKEKLFNCLISIFTVALFFVLIGLDQFLLSWGFKKEYADVIIQNSPGIMVSIMDILFLS